MNQLLKYTDFILVSDTGKEFPCNKTVLALKSDKTLEILVTFMYTHELNHDDVSIDLLVLADQYDIETLRKIGKKLPVF